MLRCSESTVLGYASFILINYGLLFVFKLQIEYFVRKIDLHKEENSDGLKLLHDRFVQEVNDHIDMRSDMQRSLLTEGGDTILGKIRLVKGCENVESSILNQPPDPKSFAVKKNSLGF